MRVLGFFLMVVSTVVGAIIGFLLVGGGITVPQAILVATLGVVIFFAAVLAANILGFAESWWACLLAVLPGLVILMAGLTAVVVITAWLS